MKVYLDNCCFNRPYDDQTQPRVFLEAQAKMSIQDMIRQKKLKLVRSSVLDYEISRSPYRDRKHAILDFIDRYSSEAVRVDASEEILKKADEIMHFGIKFYDAYHLACAIFSKCDVFLSTDRRLLRYQTNEIEIANPINFLKEMEEENE